MAAADPTSGGRRIEGLPASAGTVELTRTDDVVLVRVAGALDLALAPKLRQRLERAARLRPRVVIVDLSGLEFLASAGMAELVRAHREFPGAVRVVAHGRRTLRPLQITRLDHELALFPTLAAALAPR